METNEKLDSHNQRCDQR